MSGTIEFNGFDELEDLIQEMTLTPNDEKKAMKTALQLPFDESNKDTPILSGRLKNSEKIQIKTEDLATVGIIQYGVFWDIFEEFGTSKSKAHVGFFERAIDKTTDQVVIILANELFKKMK